MCYNTAHAVPISDGKEECIRARQSTNVTVTLLGKIACEKEKERVSFFGNKQKSNTSKLKILTPLTKPSKLVIMT